MGAELGRQPRRHLRADRPGPADGRSAGEGQGDLRAGVHVLPAADLRALPEPLLRRVVPVGRDVQARGGRNRARRSGEVPRLAVLRLGLPVQEGVLQPPHRQGREMHALLPADRGRPADDLLGDLRRADPLPRNRPLRRRPRAAAASTPDPKQLLDAQREVFLDPNDDGGPRQAHRDGIPDDWLDAARRSPV